MILDLFRLFFPRLCPGCEAALLDEEKAVCLSCLDSIPETAFHLQPCDNPMYRAFAGLARNEGAAALYYFEKGGRMQKIISALKYRNQPAIGGALGEWYGRKLAGSALLQDVELIVPVPLHPRREAMRGYNQAEEIAKGISLATGLPLRADYLCRRSATRTQTRKDRSDRWENVKEIFSVQNGGAEGLLLVDDVVTTGSTLLGCMRAIEKSRIEPRTVKVAALGYTRRKEDG